MDDLIFAAPILGLCIAVSVGLMIGLLVWRRRRG